MEAIIVQSISEAKKSSMASKHAAAIVYRSRPLIISHNIPPLRKVPGRNMESPQTRRVFFQDGEHAEVSAIRKFLVRYPRKWLQDCKLLVVRTNNAGHLLNSKPCEYCQDYIRRHKIPVTLYS